jgi:hypothetical protein
MRIGRCHAAAVSTPIADAGAREKSADDERRCIGRAPGEGRSPEGHAQAARSPLAGAIRARERRARALVTVDPASKRS